MLIVTLFCCAGRGSVLMFSASTGKNSACTVWEAILLRPVFVGSWHRDRNSLFGAVFLRKKC